MTSPLRLPVVGRFGAKIMTKEQLLTELSGVAKRANLKVNEGERVTAIDGNVGDFSVVTSKTSHRARRVVLALGLSGNPRRLECEGEDQNKVTYRLAEPDAFAKQRVLVVGGGDSAIEAALQLTTETDAQVSLSYRKAALTRCRPELAKQFHDLVDKGRIHFHPSTSVACIEAQNVWLRPERDAPNAKGQSLKNDAVVVCIGGERPTAFLEALGVNCRVYHGEPRRQTGAGPISKKSLMPSGIALTLLGFALVLGLFYVGDDYYTLPLRDREGHELHELLRPSGLWGHGVGGVATLFMLSNFLYTLRKRLGFLKGIARIRPWLTFHMFVGVMSPVVIAFHAAFQAKNGLAITTWVGLAVVVGTGVFGRFLYARLPSSGEGPARGMRKLFRVWLGLHIALATLLVLLVGGHVALSLYLGYQWLF